MKRSAFHHVPGTIRPGWGDPHGLVSVCLVAWAAAVSVVVFLDIQSSYRPLVALSFLLLAPGLALVRLLHVRDWLMEFTLAIALSLAIDALVATLFIYANAYSFRPIFFVLAYFTFLCALADQIQLHNSLLNNPTAGFSLWRVRIELAIAFLVGLVLLFLFFMTGSS